MVNISTGCHEKGWFGVAWAGTDVVATAVGSTQNKALQIVTGCVPRGIPTHIHHHSTPFITNLITMLGELEHGREEHKQFTLSNYLSKPLQRILKVAAAIPIGYVSTYGNIADAADSEARAVGRVMATNPLYPIVPCHRVVGADMAMVGYGGKQDAKALAAKLDRLAAEIRGFAENRELVVADKKLRVYPTERVFEAALAREEKEKNAARIEEERLAADRMQLRLF